MGHLDNMLQLSGLFLHFCSEEECGGSDDLMKMHKPKFRTSTPGSFTDFRENDLHSCGTL